MGIDVQNLIGGQWTKPSSGTFLHNREPATGHVYGDVPDSDAVDVERAVRAAAKAQPAWAALASETRGEYLRALAAALQSKTRLLAHAESVDTGKPLGLAERVDIPRSIRNLRFFADAATQVAAAAYHETAVLHYSRRRPLGVVGAIAPWNLPLYLLTWKVAPALAMGNCVVAKPSELTPVTAHFLAEAALEVGLPPGVLNMIHGTGLKAGEALVQHPTVSGISFTGSTRTGARIATLTAPHFKKLSLEMGGKNASIVFADADVEKALAEVVRAGFTNQGEVCLCGSRVFVQRSLYKRFRDAVVERVSALKVGDPLLEDTDQGALISEAHFQKVQSAIEGARHDGGKVLCGGERPEELPARCRDGYFMSPTVIDGLSVDCRTNQDEIFGPVMTLLPFDDEAEVVAAANATRYGLSASVWTCDVARAHRVAAALDVGMVWLNSWMLRDLRTPFGGMKDSGLGREGGDEVLRFMSEAQTVSLPYAGE